MPEARDAPRPVAFVLKGYPRLSETFIAQEIKALEDRGLSIRIVSLRHPTDRVRHPIHGEIRAPVAYLPEYLWHEPLRVLRAWRAARRLPGYATARSAWLRDLARDPTPNRIRRFGQALVLAAEIVPAVAHLHAHFLHTPASVARYAALMAGLPWSVSAHAKDVWTTPAWEKREKLAQCAWAVTCNRANLDHLAPLAPPDRVALVYHGLDLTRFPPAVPRPPRDGSNPADSVTILAVGRAVPKKGLDDLVAALALLPSALAWRFVHVGGGPLLPALKRQAAELGLGARIAWLGAQPADAVLAQYRAADIAALTVRVAGDGDRDGLPNVLVEAQSQALPVVATHAAAVEELIEDGANGLLVAPGDRPAIAAALARLIADPALRARLGAAGEALVRRDFAMSRGIDAIAARFRLLAQGAS